MSKVPAERASARKDRRWALREAAIVTAARELLAGKGYDAMTLEDVIDEVGISKPTLYRHFPSKEELGVRVLVDAMNEARLELAELDASQPPAEVMKRMIELAIDRHFAPGTHAYFTGSMPLFHHDSLRVAERDLVQALAAVTRRGQNDGTIANPAPPVLIAQTLLSILKDPSYESEEKRPVRDVGAMKRGAVKLLLG